MADTKITKKSSLLSMKSSVILLIVCPILVIALSTVAIVITAGKIVPDDMYDFTEPKEYVYDVPADDKSAVELAKALLENTEKSDIVKIDTNTSLNYSKDTGSWTDAQIGFVADVERSILGGISSDKLKTDTDDCNYGEKAPRFFPAEYLDGAKLCEDATQNESNSELSFKLKIEASGKNCQNVFRAELEKISVAFASANKDVFNAEEISVSGSDVFITVKADNVTGRLKNFTVTTATVINAENAGFVNDFAELGTKNINIEAELKRETKVTFAGIDITKTEMYISPGSYDTVPAKANLADDAEAELIYESSDESICTVDEKGMVEAVNESETPAQIKVTLKYLGKEFTDTCLIYIINKTEGIDISKATLELKKGETATLSADVKPKNATIKDLMWISSDETVAAVDESGNVTATGTGEALITAVTTQGHYMEACRVTVSE